MAEGKAESDWLHTSTVLSLLFNCHRDPKKGKASSPDDWNPYAKKRRATAKKNIPKGSITMLKYLLNPDHPEHPRNKHIESVK